MEILINAMYLMSAYGCYCPIANRRKRMNFVKAKLKEFKAQKGEKG